MKKNNKPQKSWSSRILLVLVTLVVGIGLGKLLLPASGHDTQVVSAMKKESNIQLLALSVTDIYDKTEAQDKLKIPLSDHTVWLRGKFTAHLGVNGKKVRIKKTGEHTYHVTLPKFEALSISNPHFEEVVSKNNLLSFTAPPIDKNAMQDKAINTKTLNKYVQPNIPFLKDQAQSYYTQLAKGFDSKAKLSFSFSKQ